MPLPWQQLANRNDVAQKFIAVQANLTSLASLSPHYCTDLAANA
jgi:hypothetical protein